MVGLRRRCGRPRQESGTRDQQGHVSARVPLPFRDYSSSVAVVIWRSITPFFWNSSEVSRLVSATSCRPPRRSPSSRACSRPAAAIAEPYFLVLLGGNGGGGEERRSGEAAPEGGGAVGGESGDDRRGDGEAE